MNVTERLVARRGVDAITIRDITAAAKTDVTAVNYHFGSKQHLIEATLHRTLALLSAEREPFIDALEGKDKPSARDIACCIVLPASRRAAAGTTRGRQREAFISALVRHSDFAGIVGAETERDIGRYMTALERILPNVPPGLLITRLLYAITLAHQSSARDLPWTQRWHAHYGAESNADPTEPLIDFIACGLAGGRPGAVPLATR
jgi:AcrR family transcriptional regulator